MIFMFIALRYFFKTFVRPILVILLLIFVFFYALLWIAGIIRT